MNNAQHLRNKLAERGLETLPSQCEEFIDLYNETSYETYMDLKELSHDSYYYMHNYNQLTIDLVEKTEDLYASDFEVTPEEFGALAYKIDTILEVIDKIV